MKKILTAILILSYSSYCQAQKQKIELNLLKGETYRQNMHADMSIEQSAGGQQIMTKMQINGKTAYKVLNIIDSLYDIEVRYESLGMKMDMPGISTTFDSEKEKPDDVFSKILAEMKNSTFQIRISKSGKVIEVKNMENLFSAFNNFPQLSVAEKEQLKKQLSDSYGEKTFKNNLEMSLSIFPIKPISTGDHWTKKAKFESGSSAEMETTYELNEMNSDYYLLTSESKIITPKNDTYKEINGMQIKSDFNGVTSAALKVNRKTGWIMYSKTNQHLNSTSIIKESAALPGGMTIPMKMVNIITITGQ